MPLPLLIRCSLVVITPFSADAIDNITPVSFLHHFHISAIAIIDIIIFIVAIIEYFH